MGKFNLKEGMYDEKLWKELTKIGISGESRREVQVFRDPGENYYQKTEKPLHEIIMADTKYAIIRKNNVTIDPLGGVTDNYSYYLCGVNDEEMYFVRPLFTLPKFAQLPNIQQIVDWVNRKDQGFLDRVQGDVLIKFIHKVHISELVDENKLRDDMKQKIQELRSSDVLFKESAEALQPINLQPRTSISSLNQHGNFAAQSQFEIGPFRSEQTQAVGTFGLSSEVFIRNPNHSSIMIGKSEFRRIDDRPIKLGNHRLWIEGKIYAGTKEPFVGLIADSFILQHPEHKIVERRIPENSIAILAAQRGRDFDLSDYLKRSFD